MSSSTREVLRAATHESHSDLGAALKLSPATIDEVSLRRYLSALEPWVSVVDPLIWGRSWPSELNAALRLEKVGWIREDLRRLGHRPPPVDFPQAYLSVTAGDPSDARLLGAAYVLEGLTLGGRLFSTALAERGTLPCRFWLGYGPGTSEMWKSFIGYLNSTLVSDACRDEAVESALYTFRGLHCWLADREVIE